MVFRLKDYLSAPFNLFRIEREWKRVEQLAPAEAEQYTIKQLKAMCQYVNQHVPYYQMLFSEIGFNPEQMDSLEYYRKIPVMDKTTVHINFEKLQSDEIEKLGAVVCETSGSTGTPLHFYLDKSVNQASFCLFHKTWSMDPNWHLGCKQVTLTGYAEGIYSYQWKTRILELSSFYLSGDTVGLFYNLIKKHKPKFLRGYPSALYLFGKLLEQKQLKLSFDTIFTGAESLLPFQRAYLEETFNATVIDHYTHWERTASICTCGQGKLHAQNSYGYHEIVDAQGQSIPNGEEGRLVCTGLYNHAMPLLRYDTRDIAAFAKIQSCACNSNRPVVDHIVGRIEDVVVTPEGRLVGRLDAAFKYSNNILLAHIYQPDRGHIIVKLVPTENYTYETDEQPLMDELRKRLGEKIDISIQKTDEENIPRSPKGKVRFVISDVPAQEKLGHF